MPSIHLTNGKLRYRPIPIFAGVKQINKVDAFDNLCLLKSVLDEKEVDFQITYGTLLGAVREKDFIKHDEDIDILILDEEKQKFLDTLPCLIKNGFQIARYDRRGLLSIIRNEVYIDFYFFSLKENGIRYCSGIIVPSKLIEETMIYSFKNLDVRIPLYYKDFLSYEYGNNWMTPIQYYNYGGSKIKRYLETIKVVVKEYLPDSIYFHFAKNAEVKMRIQYEEKLKIYLETKKEI